MEINRKPIRSVADYQRMLEPRMPGDVLALVLLRSATGQRAIVTVTFE